MFNVRRGHVTPISIDSPATRDKQSHIKDPKSNLQQSAAQA